MQFRKKPVIIDAVKWSGDDRGVEAVRAFCPDAEGPHEDRLRTGYSAPYLYFRIETAEGVMRAEPGDWIIKGIKGEFYPCKPDIFEATYEVA